MSNADTVRAVFGAYLEQDRDTMDRLLGDATAKSSKRRSSSAAESDSRSDTERAIQGVGSARGRGRRE
jgi:hypothetical protein